MKIIILMTLLFSNIGCQDEKLILSNNGELDNKTKNHKNDITLTVLSKNSIELKWKTSLGNIKNFEVFRDGQLIEQTTTFGFVDVNLTSNTTYYYEVFIVYEDEVTEKIKRAIIGNDSKTTFNGDQVFDNINPTKVINLNGTVKSATSLDLFWDESTDNIGVVKYKVYRDSNFLKSITSTFFTDSGLVSGKQYTYKVQALDASGNMGLLSESFKITPIDKVYVDKVSPDIVTGLRAGVTSSTSINLTWNAAFDNVAIKHYEIYRNNTFYKTSTQKYLLDTGLTSKINYEYKILAVDTSSNKGPFSATVSIVADNVVEQFKFPIEVHERSGVNRNNNVVVSGIPFEKSKLKDITKLSVIDESGSVIPSQASVTTRWMAPFHDDSVQWALVRFMTDVSANSKKKYFVVDTNQNEIPVNPILITKKPEDVVINIGDSKFIIPKSGDQIFSEIFHQGINVLGVKGLQAKVNSAQWSERGLADGSIHIGSHNSLTIEEEGPIRTIIKLEGNFAPGDKAGKYFGHSVRLYFKANDPTVQIVYSIKNTFADPSLYTLTDSIPGVKSGAYRYLFSWPIEDLSLESDLNFGNNSVATSLTSTGEISQPNQLLLVQDSSGGDQWKNLSTDVYSKWMFPDTTGLERPAVTYRGYKAFSAGTEVSSGNYARGASRISDDNKYLSIAVRHFREQFPSALDIGKTKLRIGLLPKEHSENFYIRPGQRKTWYIDLKVGATASNDNLSNNYEKLQTKLLFRPDPNMTVESIRKGGWQAGLSRFINHPTPNEKLDKEKIDSYNVGVYRFGWIPAFNAGGAHSNQYSMFSKWLMYADGDEFDKSEAKTLWYNDLVRLHWDNVNVDKMFKLLQRNWPHNRIEELKPPQFNVNRDKWMAVPDSGHMGMMGLSEYYYITGDRNTLDSIIHLGDSARAHMYNYTNDDALPSGEGPYSVPLYYIVKRFPDSESDFTLSNRYRGWPMYNAMQAYQVTGKTQYYDESKTFIGGFRNAARKSPIGFITDYINEKKDKSTYGYQGPFCKGYFESASAVYSHFQNDIVTQAVSYYYSITQEFDALDTISAHADFLVQHGMIKDSDGRPQGWTYTFGDYWGPYKVSDLTQGFPPTNSTDQNVCRNVGVKAASYFNWNRTSQALGLAYTHLGKSEYLDIIGKMDLDNLKVDFLNAKMAVNHPKNDRIPPSAIQDLSIIGNGTGSIKLQFSAPGDDGSSGNATRYQAKYSTSPIVEKTSGWPDRSGALPTTKDEYKAKAIAFNKTQRAFWSTKNINYTGTPKSFGQNEVINVSALNSGERVYFAIKTLDDDGNISEISNIVSIIIP